MLDMLRRPQYHHSQHQSARSDNTSWVCPNQMLVLEDLTQGSSSWAPERKCWSPHRDHQVSPGSGQSTRQPSTGMAHCCAQLHAGQASKSRLIKADLQCQAPSTSDRPRQLATPVLTYHGFHSLGSEATMPSRASHSSSGSLMGSIPISLANWRISAKTARRVEK